MTSQKTIVQTKQVQEKDIKQTYISYFENQKSMTKKLSKVTSLEKIEPKKYSDPPPPLPPGRALAGSH